MLSAIFYAFGEYFSKKWGMAPSFWKTILVVAVYAVGTLTWLPALLHRNEIAIMGTIWLVLAVIATVFVGVVIFQEKVTMVEWIGIILALLALAFLGFYNPA